MTSFAQVTSEIFRLELHCDFFTTSSVKRMARHVRRHEDGFCGGQTSNSFLWVHIVKHVNSLWVTPVFMYVMEAVEAEVFI